MDLYIRADFTNQPQYHIDFARGTIVHSRAASRGQSNRLFKDHDMGGTLKHLTYPQAANFYKKNRTAEFYLQYLRALYPSLHAALSMRWNEWPNKPRLPTSPTIAGSSNAPPTPWTTPSHRTPLSASCGAHSTGRN